MQHCASLEEYFYSQVKDTDLNGDVKAYLVMILAKWAREQPADTRPLATAYMEALQSQSWHLREVADRALFWVGVAPHSMGPLITRKYVENIGTSAYAHFAKNVSAHVFWALSEEFSEAAHVVREVSRTSEDLETLVSRAVAGDEADDEYLEQQGVIVLRPR